MPQEVNGIAVYKPSEDKTAAKEAFKPVPTLAVDSLDKEVVAPREPVVPEKPAPGAMSTASARRKQFQQQSKGGA